MASDDIDGSALADRYARIQIDDMGDDGLIYDEDEGDLSEIDDRWCLVGKFLTSRSIDFQAMQNRLSSLWQPVRGVYIKELEYNRYIFQFYHELDVKRVMEGSPWSFDRFPLVFERLKQGENPKQVELNQMHIWVQLHDMVAGFMSERVARDIGNYIGGFVASDPMNFTGAWREYLRIRVAIHIDKPLMKRMKLQKRGGPECWVNFKYERLPTFCFVCGIIGHSERVCPQVFDAPEGSVELQYGVDLRALPRRRNHTIASPWLRNGAETNAWPQEVGNRVPETLCRRERVEYVRRKLGYEGIYVVEVSGHSGGLAMLWKIKEDASVIGFSKNHIDVQSGGDGAPNWRLTGMYGDPRREDRWRTWALLRRLQQESSLPWCVIGDLNNVLSQADKRGGNPYPTGLVEGFNQAVTDCGLVDLPLVGYPFTWERGRGTRRWTEVRLDRALVSLDWLHIFDGVQLINLEISSSDHSPILLQPKRVERQQGERRFRFENAWISDPMCKQIIEACWAAERHIGVQAKIRSCGAKLMEWGTNVTGQFGRRIWECNGKIKRLQWGRDAASQQAYREHIQQLFGILDQHERYWKQRSKHFWLRDGDRKSKFFHATASTRRRANMITSLKDTNGVRVDWSSGLPHVVVDYFSELFMSGQSNWEELIGGVPTTITDEQNNVLLAPVEEAEVRRAVFSMHPDKSPGPDGMTPGYFQKHWLIVSEEVVLTVQNFLETCVFLENLCDTNVVLIPKKKSPETMMDLRPISLCNVLYKIVSKVVANRMQPLMAGLISDTQSAFVPGRLITDNILVSFEVMHYLKQRRRGQEGYMAVKIDMSKAYDRVEWGFLRAMLVKMGFSNRWVELVMTCVSSVRYTFVHGKHTMGPITPSRGLRQGDPLSPYLFILCTEGFSVLVRQYEERRWLQGIRVTRRAPSISHMLFADYSYVFCKATDIEATNLVELLRTFERASGQRVNFSKSSIFFSTNTTQENREVVCSRLQMREADEHSQYLGLPNTMGKNKSVILGFLKERVRKRLQSWDVKMLSRAGKEILIKTVAQSLPSYTMSVFLLPIEMSRDLEMFMTKFWWRSSMVQPKGIHWLNWEHLSAHKNAGGMGFRDLRDFNLALLGKQAWRVMMQPNSLVGRIFKAKYFPNASFLEAILGDKPSFVWRSIWEARSVVRAGMRWRVGDGSNIDIVGAPWLLNDVDPYISTPQEGLKGLKVSDLILTDRKEWNIEMVRTLFNARDCNLIFGIPLSAGNVEDQFFWSKEASGAYSVRSAYRLLQFLKGRWGNEMQSGFWKKLWQFKLPPKVKDLLWRACRDCLPTLVQLRTKRVLVDATCPACGEEEESILHALVKCRLSRQCLNTVAAGAGEVVASSFSTWIVAIRSKVSKEELEEAMAVCWALWRARNELVWNGKSTLSNFVISSAKEYLVQWRTAQRNDCVVPQPTSSVSDGARTWVRPQSMTVKINADAEIFEERGGYGLGLVSRDHNGQLIEAMTRYRVGVVSPNLAEVIAVREALSWIKDRGWPVCVLETDCLVVVNAIRCNLTMTSPFGLVVDECRSLMRELGSVYILFVYRSANMVAHSLARVSVSFPEHCFSGGDVPAGVLSRLLADLS